MACAMLLLTISGLLFISPSYARRKSPPRENPIDKILAQADFNPSQFAGKWYLVGVASRCGYLRDNSHRLEPVNIMASVISTAPQGSMLINTFRPSDGICWNIRQVYSPAGTPGRFILRDRGRPVDIVIGETDYRSYAIVFYQKSRQISVKLYGRNIQTSDSIVAKFEQLVTGVGLSEDLTYYFPTYGFCDSADQFHILDETKYTGV
ncbi:complement component C8 gamma chain [Sphaerodactylus townsendi]|uniref:complement component C8 gamma chain n=1 Tax=Sphaerodactylus townsendi TaxID=933632 RepID=UPI00202747D8|nr:complement component C8 gamma chain [Sphaerodactylus townsendi]